MLGPRLIFSSKVFQVVLVHLVYNSALGLAPCCFSSFLDVAVHFICIFLVSSQPALLSTLPKLFHSFCGKKNCGSRCCFFVKNFISTDVNRFCPVLQEYTAPLARWQESSQFPVWEPQVSRKFGSFLLTCFPKYLKRSNFSPLEYIAFSL